MLGRWTIGLGAAGILVGSLLWSTMPRDLRISDCGKSVCIQWNPPAMGNPDAYIVTRQHCSALMAEACSQVHVVLDVEVDVEREGAAPATAMLVDRESMPPDASSVGVSACIGSWCSPSLTAAVPTVSLTHAPETELGLFRPAPQARICTLIAGVEKGGDSALRLMILGITQRTGGRRPVHPPKGGMQSAPLFRNPRAPIRGFPMAPPECRFPRSGY